jgi:Tol biopolymer transport system component/DNA-binding winged helix-turn-helix (wHTH) protein
MKAEAVCYQFDGVEVRPESVEALRAGKALELEPKAFRVLVYLIENRRRAVGKDELIATVWDGAAVSDNALTRVIAQLRKELGDDARQPRFIQTLPTLGYRFIAELDPPPAAPAPHSRRVVYSGIMAAAVAIGAVAWWIAVRSSTPAASHLPPVQLTTAPGLDMCGGFSPDGGRLLYASDRGGRFDLYVRSLDPGGVERQVTNDHSQNVDPAWSPDGKWIAYHSAARHGVWVAPAEGGAPRRVADFGSNPSWSPDGSQIAFRSCEPFSFALFDLPGSGESTIWTVAPDGTGLRRITEIHEPRGAHAAPDWSPDGRRIVFTLVWMQAGLWTVDVDTRALTAVGGPASSLRLNPIFTVDGRSLFYGARSVEGWSVYRTADDGGASQVALYPARPSAPLRMAISPDGRTLASTQATLSSQLWITSGDGSPERPLFQDAVARVKRPAFSPDGERVAFIVQREGSSQDLWIMNADGSGAAPAAAGPGAEEAPQWTADGDLYYVYTENGKSQLRRLRAGRGAPQTAVDDVSALRRVSITPDGRNLVYDSGHPANVWVRPLHGGAPRQLTFDRQSANFPVISPDGRWVVFSLLRGGDSQVGLVPLQGGAMQVLTAEPGQHWPGSWSSDSRRIALSVFRDGVWNLRWLDRETREFAPVTHETAFGSYVRAPAWRPGSNQIVYEWSRSKGNIYLVDLAQR